MTGNAWTVPILQNARISGKSGQCDRGGAVVDVKCPDNLGGDCAVLPLGKRRGWFHRGAAMMMTATR
jgi:hypothetical protein